MKKLIIMRGVSGSGKSTRTKELIEELNPSSNHVCSADNFFVTRPHGEYKFDPKQLGQAHAWCRGNASAAMSLGTELVVIDNTNTQKREFQAYLDMASDMGYETEEVVVGEFSEAALQKYFERNAHGVPLVAIKRMAARFEK